MEPLINTVPAKFIVAGIFIFSLSFVITHVFHTPDAVNGLLKGIGIGLMLLGLLRPKRSEKCELQPVRVKSKNSTDRFSN